MKIFNIKEYENIINFIKNHNIYGSYPSTKDVQKFLGVTSQNARNKLYRLEYREIIKRQFSDGIILWRLL